ncbi:dihydrodipicolinate synthase family protein [Flexithrix dorotheae]|uniref:dihydrodipicolinate synthase family protein n=1 Tax=Flexithrix dorotheae TaxID=70993 RepID=UPI00036F4484|nr:dihydrodipicolinate synthase family protein [Flexithrix dorotheae]
MKKLYPLHGIVTVLNTPFAENGEIDFNALQKNVEEALLAGISGFLVPAMASEVHTLTLREKLKMIEVVLERVNQKVPVFAGTAAPSLKDSADFLRACKKIGVREFLIQLPFQNENQFKQDFYKLAEQDPEVIMLQDWDAGNQGLPDHLIMELFNTVPAFRCLKVETVPAGLKYSRMLELSNGTMNISGGWAVANMPEAIKRGVHAFMPTGMHWIYSRIFRDFQQGDDKNALELFHQILPILAFSNQHLDISIHFFKRLLWRQGIYPTPNLRKNTLPFDHIHQEIADQLINQIILIEKTIKNSL